jgi:hypothetical protein
MTADIEFETYLAQHQEPAPDITLVTTQPGSRSVKLTAASTIVPRPVRWLWHQRVALGSIALLAGREGIGKSTVAYTLAADITRGRLPGRYQGQNRAVIVAATEDSWEFTIVPRLMAAGANLDLVYRVDVTTSDNVETGLSLPRDLAALERAVKDVNAALILLDPLMSRLDADLDSHKDAEVRLALEPIVAIADRTGCGIVGLIHVNKSHSSDPLTLIMGSRAFTAVSRAVLFVMLDPEDETIRLLGQPKNNLGSTDLPTLAFAINSHHVTDTDEGPIYTGKISWLAERADSIRDVLEAAGEAPDVRTASAEAAAWLHDYLEQQGGGDDSADIKEAGKKAGHSLPALHRARQRLKVTVVSHGYPKRTNWALPGSRSTPGESTPTETNETTETTGSHQ